MLALASQRFRRYIMYAVSAGGDVPSLALRRCLPNPGIPTLTGAAEDFV
jgi:hypothetical protein